MDSIIADLLENANQHKAAVAGICFVVWVGVVRVLRYRTRDAKHKEFPYRTRESFKNMTVQDAWAIQQYILLTEFPWIGEKSLQFALFRTYGIPTISKLLVETRQLSTAKYAGRRYTDTEVLITEFVNNPPSSERTVASIARMNYLHGRHVRLGKISNDDFLYTLSLFALEPQRWIDRYEWRTLTEMEICALGTFWKHLGDSMQISYEVLGDDIHDGFSWWKALRVWSEDYEKRCMLPNEDNYNTAIQTVTMLLYDVPKPMISFGNKVVWALMDERLRRAMMFPDPPKWLDWTIDKALLLRGSLIKYFFLPRPWAFRNLKLGDPDPVTGLTHSLEYVAEPWYVKSTFRNSWGPWALMRRLTGKPIPGPKFQDSGYVIHEVGPRGLKDFGQKEQATDEERLRAMDRVGCPFK